MLIFLYCHVNAQFLCLRNDRDNSPPMSENGCAILVMIKAVVLTDACGTHPDKVRRLSGSRGIRCQIESFSEDPKKCIYVISRLFIRVKAFFVLCSATL